MLVDIILGIHLPEWRSCHARARLIAPQSIAANPESSTSQKKEILYRCLKTSLTARNFLFHPLCTLPAEGPHNALGTGLLSCNPNVNGVEKSPQKTRFGGAFPAVV